MFVSRKFAQLTEYFCTKGNLHCWLFASGLGLHPYPGIPKPPQGHAHVCFWSNAFRFWFVFLNSSTTTELESIACALFRRVIEQTALSQHGSGGPPPTPQDAMLGLDLGSAAYPQTLDKLLILLNSFMPQFPLL